MTYMVAVGFFFSACASNPDPLSDVQSRLGNAPQSIAPSQYCAGHIPDPKLTPGVLCTPDDPNFEEYRYKEHIPYCRRNVSMGEKDNVANEYGVAVGDLSNYEVDHFIPLGIGGSDDPENLWPQPLDEAHEKDQLEDEVYNGLNDGTLTQADAVAKIRAWRPSGFSGCSTAE